MIFCSALLRNTPISTLSSNSSFPPWFDKDLIKLCRLKNSLHKRIASGDVKTREKFSEVRRQFKSLSALSFKRYTDDLAEKICEDPKTFFDFVNIRKKTKKFPSMMKFGNILTSSDKEIADQFANFFSSVYVPSSISCTREPPSNPPLDLNMIQFVPLDVVEGLKNFDGNKGPGPDKIPPKVLKETADAICFPLCIIFNVSLKSGVFPSLWKFSSLVPIFKKGDKSEIVNYRNVAIQNAMPKLFDKMVFGIVRNALSLQLSHQQHGFMAQKSTTTNLVVYSSFVSREMEHGFEVDSIYTDFSKAFDKVSHHIIIEKLERFGFGRNLVNWFRSFLSERRYSVRFGDAESFEFVATSGVPPGTHGGPDLFLIMINDLPDILQHSQISIYADDCKIFKRIQCEMDVEKLQEDLTRFGEWCSENELAVNVDKCASITFSRRKTLENKRRYTLNGQLLALRDVICDLGVDFDSKLSFSEHLNRTVSKASKTLGFIRRFSQDFHDPLILKTLYCALVRPHLEYCSLIWSPNTVTGVSRIESIQRKFTKLICKRLIPQRELSYENRCSYLGLDSLTKRRQQASQIFTSNVLCGRMNCSEILSWLSLSVPRITSRNNQLLKEPNHKSKFGSNNPITRLCNDFNQAQTHFDFHLTNDQFKSYLKN